MTTTMQAIQYDRLGGPEVMRVVELPVPEPLPGFVRVRNHAIAVNFHDINTRRGDEPDVALPVTPGTDFAGVVDAVGEGVEHLKVGDRVLCINTDGAYAEFALAFSAIAVPIPDGLSFAQAAACPVAGLTAYFLAKQICQVTPDTVVLTHAAAGSVGCFLGGLLRQIGATGIGLVSSDEKAAVALRAGHTHVINYRREDPLARVRQLTDGRGADVVYDSVAGPNFQRTVDMTATEGTIVLFGHAAGDPPAAAINYWLHSGRNLALRTYFLGTTIQAHMEQIAGVYGALFDGLMSGAIALPIETMALRDAAKAHARIESQQTFGKIILTP
ncbi:MAG: zinc-binding dehydrogenase [Deltaproteobacteria bacterium]|nr:zinc-binding dehydrogenase [Deltaproteobacteria bacterium]